MHIHINPATIHAFDRLAHYGDGCFTTAAFSNGHVEYLPAHLARLERDAQSLALPFRSESIQKLHTVLVELAAKHRDGTLKVLISSGLSERGYQRAEAPVIQAYVFILPKVARYDDWRENGISVALATTPLNHSPEYAGHKHANRLEQVLLKEQIPAGCDDALVLNEEGHLVETTAANVFFRIGQCWYTPEIIKCGVNGVMRNRVMQLMGDNKQPVQEIMMASSELKRVNAMFICNSLMRIVPVHRLSLGKDESFKLDIARVSSIQQLVDHDIS
ncbi:MAG: aminodeoxychorismate lyase [Aestuariibacter sp.]